MLAPLTQITFSPTLAVNEAGDVLVAWFSGKPPPTFADGPPQAGGVRNQVKIAVARGSFAGGFRAGSHLLLVRLTFRRG